MAGLAMEFVLTIVAAIVLLPLALVILKALDSLDADDVDAATKGQRSETRPWNRQAGSAVLWVAPGSLVPAMVGWHFARREVWVGLALYGACNLLGTLMALREFELGPRATRFLKALFVFQVPTGVLFLVANGL